MKLIYQQYLWSTIFLGLFLRSIQESVETKNPTDDVIYESPSEGSSSAECIVSPNYCDAIIQEATNDIKTSFQEEIKKLGSDIDHFKNLNKICENKLVEYDTRYNQLVIATEQKEQSSIAIMKQEQQAMLEEQMKLQEYIKQLEQTTRSALDESYENLQKIKNAETDVRDHVNILERHIEGYKESKKRLFEENKHYIKVIETLKNDLFEVRRELFQANEILRKPIDRRLKYERWFRETWKAIQQSYYDFRESIHPTLVSWQEYYLSDIEPRISRATDYVVKVSLSFYRSAKPYAEPVIEQLSELIQSSSATVWNQTEGIRTIVYDQGILLYGQLTPWIESNLPSLTNVNEEIVDIVYVMCDLWIALFSEVKQTKDLNTAIRLFVELIIIPSFMFVREYNEEIVIIVEGIIVSVILLRTAQYFLLSIVGIIFGLSSTIKKSTKS